jgi:ArsR family transcriptional regulator
MNTEPFFKAMADTTRRRILQIVARHELSVSELVECLAQPQSTVSRHLKVLRDAGLIVDRREANSVHYAAVEHGNGGFANHDLERRLIEWLGQEELPQPLQRRLNRVIAERQNRSSEFFSRAAHRWDHLRLEAFGDAFHLEALAALLPPDWIVADIGTGTGYMLPVLAGAFRKVIAVDPVPEMLEVARARCRAESIKNVTFRKGDVGHLPIENAAVDLALAVLVLHHVPVPADALRELGRVVKPAGRILIVEQRTHRLESFHERMQDRWWGFEPAKLSRSVAAAGFEQIRCRTLATHSPQLRAVESPELFTLTAQRSAAKKVNARNTKRT